MNKDQPQLRLRSELRRFHPRGRAQTDKAVWSAEWNIEAPTSAKCKLVRKPHTNLSDTLVNCTSAYKYFQMIPVPTGAKQRPLRLYKSILRCSWKHLQLWRCIQDAPSGIVKFGAAETSVQICGRLREQLRPLCSSAGDLLPSSHSGGSKVFITTRHFMYHIHLCYSHKLPYIIIWHVLSF